MSIVDALALPAPLGEHTAPARSRRHAFAALMYVTSLPVLT